MIRSIVSFFVFVAVLSLPARPAGYFNSFPTASRFSNSYISGTRPAISNTRITGLPYTTPANFISSARPLVSPAISGNGFTGLPLSTPLPAFTRVAGAAKEQDEWYLFIEDDWKPWGWVNEQGEFVGFHVDLSEMVCKAAGVKCVFVGGVGANCVDSNQETGKSLRSLSADACVGWGNTLQRARSGTFSQGWTQVGGPEFYVKEGTEVGSIAGKKVGILAGWNTNEGCLMNKANVDGTDSAGEVVEFTTTSELFAAINAGDVHMGFADDLTVPDGIEEVVIDNVKCVNDGWSLFAQKKNRKFVDKWDAAFDKVKGSSEFQAACAKHGIENKCKSF